MPYTIENPNGNEPDTRAMGEKRSIIDDSVSVFPFVDNDSDEESRFVYGEEMEPNQYDKTGSNGFWSQHH